MLVSVVIPTLNEENYLPKLLESLRAQETRHEFEVIVADGHSSDSTAEIARNFGATVVFEKNRSATWERQAGALAAKGEVIAFTDADAVLPNDWVETVASGFQRTPGLVMYYGPVYILDGNGIARYLWNTFVANFQGVCFALGVYHMIGANFAVRRAVFFSIGGFNTKLVTCEDLDLAKRISKEGSVKFSQGLFVHVSARRAEKWGYLEYALFHIVNGLLFQFAGKSKADYAPVR